MLPIAGMMFLFFFPACLGIFRQVILGDELGHQLLALGMFLFCIEQARMATQDLRQIAEAKEQVKDIRLKTFSLITISTIIIEILGFYTSSIWLGWGSVLILMSQFWFNLFAAIKICLGTEVTIQSWEISERLPVLIANVIGLVLISLWMSQIASLWIAGVLFGMVLLYCSIKLFLFFRHSNFV
jgi:hypothetical protein